MTETLRDGSPAPAERPPDYARFRLMRLCPCPECEGSGKEDVSLRDSPRCSECRGEGRILQEVATAPDTASVGLAIVELGREGEWSECPFGLIDSEGEVGKKWIVLPFLPSPRNVTDAARLLARSKTKGEK